MADGGIGEAALIGAAFGGAKAVATGEDPLKGALLGGAMGGVTGGMFGGASTTPLTEIAPTAEAVYTPLAENALGGMSSGISALPNIATDATTTNLGGMVGSGGIANAGNPALGTLTPNFSTTAAHSLPQMAPQGIAENLPGAMQGVKLTPAELAARDAVDAASTGSATAGIRETLGLKPGSIPSQGLDWWDKQDTLGRAGAAGMAGYGIGALTAPLPVVDTIPKEKSKLAGYDRESFTPYSPTQPQPYYRAQYAEGGVANLNNQYPQSQQFSNDYASSINPPMGNEVVNSGYEQQTNAYTGEPVGYNDGGIASLGGYAAGGNPQLLAGPGDGMSDSIPASIGNKQPARLAQGEFVVPADVVSHLGNGSTDAGAKHLYSMMDKVRKARTGNKKQGKQINPNKFVMA